MSSETAKATPYQLDTSQTTKACQVLLKHIREKAQERTSASNKADLLADDDDDGSDAPEGGDSIPIWLIVTTKKHIVDQKRLKPGKITLPCPIYSSANKNLCLITADPQATYKDLIADTSFPQALRTRIGRVISLSSLKQNYKTFESRRQLCSEHDLFLADDRIITYLPQTLGKIFYKSGSKRPIPVDIAEGRPRGSDGKTAKTDVAKADKRKGGGVEGGKGAAKPTVAAREIEKALNSALIHMSPGTSTAVKVGLADKNWTSEMVFQNIAAVVDGLTAKFITQGWRNVRAIHIKGPNSMAFPVWLADQLWVDEEDVLEEKKVMGKKHKQTSQNSESNPNTVESEHNAENTLKRKVSTTAKQLPAKHAKKKRKAEIHLAPETAERKTRLRQHKDKVMSEASGVTL